MFWEYAHLKSLDPKIVLNAHVVRGQTIGILGRTGPSGNFSHMHVGSYLSPRDLDTDNRNSRLNLYPWLVAAYQAQHPKELLAVARPHHTVLTGERVVFDGSNSLAFGGSRIVERRWSFPDGQTVSAARAEKQFDRPGAYLAALWVRDDQGREDVDFSQIKVYDRTTPERAMPHIYMTYTPTQEIRPGQPVAFRFWLQGHCDAPIQVDFGDGTRLPGYRSYADLSHSFSRPGLHIVTAQCECAGKPIRQELKVVVAQEPASHSSGERASATSNHAAAMSAPRWQAPT